MLPFFRRANTHLALGTAAGRRRDLAEVQDLIRVRNLGEDFATQLDPSVRDLFKQLWAEVQAAPPEA